MITDKENGYYLIRNMVTGTVYIGGTKHPIGKRWNGHRYDLRNGNHGNSSLQNDWNKYGEVCFTLEILENNYTGFERENELIVEYSVNCYNKAAPIRNSQFKDRRRITTGVIGKMARGCL